MSSLFEWLLGLENIRLGRDAPVYLEWSAHPEPWMLFGIGVLAAAWVGALYHREPTTAPRRVILAFMRFALIALVVAVICQPSLVLQRNRVERSHVVLLMDTSMSMDSQDAFRDVRLAAMNRTAANLTSTDRLEALSRLEIARRALQQGNASALRTLLSNNGLQLATFDVGVTMHGSSWSDDELGTLLTELERITADGRATDIAGAIADVIERSRGRRLAAIVLVSDGQATQAVSLKDALVGAVDQRIPVYPVRIGSPDQRLDIDVGPLRAQETVFANDILAIEARVAVRGTDRPTPVMLRLIDEQTESVAATESVVIDPDAGAAERTPQATTDGAKLVELRTRPGRTGRISYRVEADPLPDEWSLENNVDRITVAVTDHRVRVLYVDGYPRYEYRYLKNALLREPTVEVSILLLEADERFVQEGTFPIRRFPETPEELNRFDVVLFGDVDPRGGWLAPAQVAMLLDFVSQHGGGFGLIAGERSAPQRYADTPMERLIPVRIDPTLTGRAVQDMASGFRPKLTLEGRRARLFRFTADREQDERMFEGLPEWYWVARTLGPRPGAGVIAEHPSLQSAYGPMPLIVTGRYGAGKLFFQATDDTWRWRRHSGELLHDAYWVQVVRELAPSSRIAQDRRYALRADRRVYDYGDAVRVQLEIFDASLLAQQRERIEIVLSDASDEDQGVRPGAVISRLSLDRLSEQSNLFEGAVIPPGPGRYALWASDIPARPGEPTPSVLIRVEPPNLEARRPEADHETLERIAAITGGRVVNPDELNEAFALIQDRNIRIPDDITEPLWDSRLVFILFVLMITAEWVLRKAFGLM
jgi:hypothetical protein